MTNTELLRDAIQKRGLKYKYIAEALGLSTYGLQKKIKGESEFKASEIMVLCDLLGLDEEARSAIFFTRKRDEKSHLTIKS